MDIQKIVICSDGLTDMLSDDDIKNILLQNESVENNVDSLVKQAMENGGVDNTTVMVFEVSEETEKDSKLNNMIGTMKKIFNRI